MKFKVLIPVFFLCFNLYSQDSSMVKPMDTTTVKEHRHGHHHKAKILKHEIGFNTVSLVKQMISNNPSSTLPQLPYAVFYNLYYKNTLGFRLGLGMTSTTTETKVEGQSENRVTENKSQDIRLGLSYNFIKSNRLTANAFVDYVHNRTKLSTVSTTTTQTFPDPISTLKVESTDRTWGNGAEVGVGIKYNILKHLSVYAEVPAVYTRKTTTSETKVDDSGIIDKTKSTIYNNNFQIILPTTVYLVLTF